MINDLRELSSELVVLSARLVREIRRNSPLLPSASTRVLSLLDELGPSTVSALAASDGCSQPTMTGTVTGLVDKDLVERTPHPDDARSSLILMTPAGRRTLATVVAERIAASGRTPDELATAVAVLNDLIEPREKKD